MYGNRKLHLVALHIGCVLCARAWMRGGWRKEEVGWYAPLCVAVYVVCVCMPTTNSNKNE